MQDEADGADDTSVRVAVRIRPQNSKEKIEMNRICTSVADEEKQILLGEDKAFTFDYTFDMHVGQAAIFDSLARSLIDGCLEGYNATLFAYGQTGSGKTYTMGTGFDLSPSSNEAGIIPRAVSYLFGQIESAKRSATQRGLPVPEFKVVAQFLELYNEVLIDLLDVARDAKNKKSQVKIHENAEGGIYITGVSTRVVQSLEDTMRCLQDGALCRSTGSTNMNAQSSRSHAIFTLHIRQKRLLIVDEESSPFGSDSNSGQPGSSSGAVGESQNIAEFETLTAKFHFVDLAGSERLKRTGATGDRAREGISINCGLLALGNVISALGDRTKKGCHVPYRDSKLTRLLQDSLGGNSRTIMVACISPSDCDFMETLNTLKYANRARNIKNKVSVNQDKTSKQIAALRAQLQALQAELDDYKMGKRVVLPDGSEVSSDLHTENTMLQAENDKLRDRIKVLQSTLESIKARNAVLLTDCEVAQSRLRQMDPNFNEDQDLELTLGRLTGEMEDLRTRLAEAEATVALLQRQRDRQRAAAASSSSAAAGGGTHRSVAFSASDFPDTPSDEFSSATFDSVSMMLDSAMTASVASVSLASGLGARDSSRASTGLDSTGPGATTVTAGGASDEEAASDVEGLEDSDDGEDSEDNEAGEQNGNYLDASLADLQREISQKQRLITEIETKQRQLRAVRDHYEKQLSNLQARIKETEAERDRVLQNLEQVESSGEEKVRRVQQEYQNKLQSLQEEVSKLKKASAQHNRLLANQAKKEAELHRMHSELDDLKRTKVTLMQKLREESKRTQAAEQRHVREMHQLRKEKRQAEGQVRSLQERARQTEQVLRRKQEEVQSLRRRPPRLTSAASAATSGSVGSTTTAASSNAATASTVTTSTGSTLKSGRRQQRVAVSSSQQQQQLSARAMKGRWDSIERALSTTVGRRQTVGHLAADMENWVHEREKLARRLDQLNAKRSRFERVGHTAGPDWDQLLEQMRNARAQAELAQDNIAECQRSIIELEEQRLPDSSALFGRLGSLQEARYLLERLYQLALDRGLSALQRETELRDARALAEAKAKETEQALEMLQIALKQAPVPGLDADDLFFGVVGGGDGEGDAVDEQQDDDEDADSLEEGDGPKSANAAAGGKQQQAQMFTLGAGVVDNRSRQKRKTTTAEELLGLKSVTDMSRSMDEGALTSGPLRSNNSESVLIASAATSGVRVPGNSGSSSTGRPKSFRLPLAAAAASTPPSSSQPTTPSSAGGRLLKFPTTCSASALPTATASTSGPAAQRVLQQQQQQLLMSRPASKDGMTTSFYIPRQHADIPEVESTPDAESIVANSVAMTTSVVASSAGGLDQNFRRSGSLRSRDPAVQASMGNVFNRLTSGSVRSSPSIERGSINPYPSGTPGGASRPLLECSHTAEGHTKPVLDLDVRADRMLTGSKDRTAKLWDLNAMAEIRSLEDHHNNVSKVRYWSAQQLALTVCSFYIKVWDERSPGPCVRTLLSTGLSQAEPPEVSMGLRQNVCPPGETNIMDMALPDNGNAMFLATANSVKVWDLRRFAAIGKLHGSHQAPVMVLACERGNGGCQVVTGSKDHYMKVFWVSDGAMGLLTPTADLQPPHYDGIESLALRGSALYSASRDGGLKKWLLGPNCQQVSCVNSAHKDWVQGLALSDDGQRLYSACRSGVLKVWDAAGDLACIGELPTAHGGAAINAVHQCSGRLYTASNDNTVKFWRELGSDLATAGSNEGNLNSL